MKRVLVMVLAALAVASAAGFTASANAMTYYCAQFSNPTVNQAWQTVCNAPQDIRKP